MRTTLRSLLALALALTMALLVAACGSDDDGAGDSAGTDQAAQESGGREGGTATFHYASFPDFLDPALAYTVNGWEALGTTNLPPLTYAREEGQAGARLIPALVEAMPEVSEDGKTYKMKLREGLKYSDGTPVKASDFEHTIKRVLSLESGGASFYQPIVGASDYLEAGKARADIPGITTNDQTGDIQIELEKPRGDFPFILAMDFAGMVPGDTPFENMTQNPAPGVGPFKITDVTGNRSFVLEKNANYPEIPGVPPAKLDKITVNVVKNQERSVRDALQNKADFVDEPPSGDALREFRQTAPDRFRPVTTNSTYFFYLNHRTKPFDDIRVRQAVAHAIDRRDLQRLFGGLLAPGCNFLPPGMDGYRQIQPCPYGNPDGSPNLARARQLIEEAGAAGTKVTVWGNDEDPAKPVTEYLAGVLNEIGLEAKPQIVEASVWIQTIGNQKTKAQAGFFNWFQDYPHPANFMFLVDGDSIQDVNNFNLSNVNDPQIDQLLDRANSIDLSEAAPLYAQADRRVVEEAHVVPYGHRQIPLITSERIAFDKVLFHPVLQVDFTTFQLE
jgi:peptide/nickel transport system substrate-binding protein